MRCIKQQDVTRGIMNKIIPTFFLLFLTLSFSAFATDCRFKPKFDKITSVEVPFEYVQTVNGIDEYRMPLTATGIAVGRLSGIVTSLQLKAKLSFDLAGNMIEEIENKMVIKTPQGNVKVHSKGKALILAIHLNKLFEDYSNGIVLKGIRYYSAYGTEFSTTVPQLDYLNGIYAVAREKKNQAGAPGLFRLNIFEVVQDVCSAETPPEEE